MERRRIFREGDRVASLGCQSTDLLCRLVYVEERQNAACDEPVWIAAAPFVNMPVVVGLDHDLVDRRVGALVQHLSRKAGPVGKVEARERPTRRHVTHPLMYVVATRAHLAVAGRVDVVHLGRLARDGIQAKVAALLLAVPPLLEATFVGLHPRSQMSVLCRNVTLEHVRWFRDVIIHADEDHVLCLHRSPFGPVRATYALVRQGPYYIQFPMHLPLSRTSARQCPAFGVR